MTVAELIEKLKTYPEEMMVVVDGYACNFTNISSVAMDTMIPEKALEEYPDGLNGRHEATFAGNGRAVKVVAIYRESF